MKKVLSLVLALALMLTMASVSATAENIKVMTTDVVVVGGGGAGLSAAIEAARNGANVILIEKLGYLGGATLMSGGLIPAVGTKEQVEAGIDDNLEWFVRDIMRPSNYSVRDELVYTVAENAKPTIEWLEELGVNFSVVTSSLYYGQSNYRMHLAEGSGKGLTSTVIAYAEGMENLTILLNTPGTALITDTEGTVLGVTAESEGAELSIMAKNVVLATSGFAANHEMVEKYIPEMADAYPLYAAGATGDGIQWGMDIGAAVANMGSYQGHAFYCEGFGSTDQGIANRGGIFVNNTGVRFCNEYGGYSELSPHVLHQPGHYAYMIFDQANADATARFADFEAAGIVASGATADELAANLGIDAEKLAQTFTEYQASIARGEDEFNRTKLPASFEGPFYAIKITGDLRHTQGGLVTDIDTHVLKNDGTVIQGLYAAGGCTEGFSSEGGAAYMSGNGLLQAIVYGKIAGEKAATEVRGEVSATVWVNPNAEAEEAVEVTTIGGADVTFIDGVYEGTSKGNNGDITVKVTVEGGKVTNVEVTDQAETEAIYSAAAPTVLAAIVSANGTADVDTVTGATNSSNGILHAVEAALVQAR